MHKVLILGAGMVANPIIKYLLNKGMDLTVAAMNFEEAEKMVEGYPNGRAIFWKVEDESTLDRLTSENDIIVSLLPFIFHLTVARACLRNSKNLVTTSYVKPEMRLLDKQAKEKGIIILNEIGLDPGIDHMSAMRVIDRIHSRGGKVDEFYSLCGALPAPEAADNPLKYKFSWSPKGVVMAGNNDALYLRHGKVMSIPTDDLFKNPMSINFPEVGDLHIYPNRDSLSYQDIYGIPESKTVYRGTLRYPGWCETLDAIKALHLLKTDKSDFTGMSYAEYVASMIGINNGEGILKRASSYVGLPEDAHAIRAIEWLGLFSNNPMNRKEDTPFEITSDLMIDKLVLLPEERDMIALMHIFRASWPDGSSEIIKSHMLDFGSLKTDTAIARSVAIPAAIGVEMILEGKIREKGVHIPVLPGIYNPVLDQLEKLGIKVFEEYGLPLSQNL